MKPGQSGQSQADRPYLSAYRRQRKPFLREALPSAIGLLLIVVTAGYIADKLLSVLFRGVIVIGR